MRVEEGFFHPQTDSPQAHTPIYDSDLPAQTAQAPGPERTRAYEFSTFD